MRSRTRGRVVGFAVVWVLLSAHLLGASAALPRVGRAPADQTTLVAVADTWVCSGSQNKNWGDWNNIQVGFADYFQVERGLVQFDLSSIPAGVQVTQATLEVYYYLQSASSSPMTMTAYRVTDSWTEMQATWSNAGEAFAEAYGSVLLPSQQPYQAWKSLDVTGLVQGWLAGTYDNYGIMLRGSEGLPENYKYFYTKESDPADHEARLVVTWQAGENTPPTIDGLPDQQLTVGGSADNAIDLWNHAGDAEDADADLTFTIANAPDPDAGVTLDGNRYVDLNPAGGWTGTAEVQIQVQDTGGLTDSDSFNLVVLPSQPERVFLPLVLRNQVWLIAPYVTDSTTFAPFAGSTSTYLVGQVHNPMAEHAGFVQIHSRFYDAQGTLLKEGNTYACVDNLAPGMTSPFVDILPNLAHSTWSRYDLWLEWNDALEAPVALGVENENAYFDSEDAFHVTGTARNSQSQSLEHNLACVAMLDAASQTIGVWWDDIADLAPGGSDGFDVEVYFWKGRPNQGQMAAYLLQVYAQYGLSQLSADSAARQGRQAKREELQRLNADQVRRQESAP